MRPLLDLSSEVEFAEAMFHHCCQLRPNIVLDSLLLIMAKALCLCLRRELWELRVCFPIFFKLLTKDRAENLELSIFLDHFTVLEALAEE